MSLDLADIQGLIHHGYSYSKLRHLLFEITNAAAGRNLLKFLVPRTAHAAVAMDPKPDFLLNVGVTHGGLLALGAAPDLMDRFPLEFKQEPDPATMGDIGASAAERWWNMRFQTSQVHLIVHLYGKTTQILDHITAEIRTQATGICELLPMQNGGPLEGGALGEIPGEVHFGYRDGISQPDVRWGDDSATPGTVDYRHFLLGYASGDVPSQPKAYPSVPASLRAAEFAKNGCYSVFRWLHQDVALFNRFLAEEGPKAFPDLSPGDAEELLAAKLMGRWRDGTPLIRSPTAPNPAFADDDAFNYSQDTEGLRCPISAHIRVNNPRDQVLDDSSQLMGGVPRVIRRGAPCGPRLEGTVDDGEERGLAGMFLCSSIQRQFYKLVVWMKENSFSPSFKDPRAQDPLANRQVPQASNQYSIPTSQGVEKVTLQDFVTTKGTAFFLLPSLTSLRRLADDAVQ